jgi:lysophospholipase L1-like esterase
MNWSKKIVAGFTAVLLLFCGCEDGGGRAPLGEGHDFGANNSDVYVSMGDSITRGKGASIPYPAVLSSMLQKAVINRGVDGARAGAGYAQVAEVLSEYKPGFLLICYGANDAIRATEPGTVVEQLRGIISAARANKTIPVIATCLPQIGDHGVYNGGIIALNARLRALAAEEDVTLVELETPFIGHPEYFTEDGLHPNNTGHSIIAAEFFDEIN